MNNSASQFQIPFRSLLEQIRDGIPGDIPVYLVGGAVRDLLLQREVHDLDFALPYKALEVSRAVAHQLGAAFYPLDKERETGRVIFTDSAGKKWHIDFAEYRGLDLESDLKARDFTINAIALNLQQPMAFIDPLGGAVDLQKKVLRSCAPNSIEQDAVRILRALRFATHFNLRIYPETLQSMRFWVGKLPGISPERVRDELFRILEGPSAATCLRGMDMIGALPYLLPELEPLDGLVQSPPHIADAWNHTLDVLTRLEHVLTLLSLGFDPESGSSLFAGLASLLLGRYRGQITDLLRSELSQGRSLRSLLFFAALYHDAGKSRTMQKDESGRIRYFGHDKIGAELVSARARQMHLSNDEIDRLSKIVLNHMRPILLAQSKHLPSRRAIYRYFRDTEEAGVDVCLLSIADVWATYGAAMPQDIWQNHLEVVRALLEAWWEKPGEIVSPLVLLNGNELMTQLSLMPGPIVGKLLEEIREAQAIGLVANRDQALDLARSILSKRGAGQDKG